MANVCREGPSVAKDNEALLKSKQALLNDELLQVLPRVHSCTSIDAVDAALEAVRKLKMLLSVQDISESFAVTAGEKEPANKNAPKQARFFSTERKRAKKDETKTLTNRPSRLVRSISRHCCRAPTAPMMISEPVYRALALLMPTWITSTDQ